MRQPLRLTLKPGECHAWRGDFSDTILIQNRLGNHSDVLSPDGHCGLMDGRRVGLIGGAPTDRRGVRQALLTSTSLAKWSGLTLVGGMILLLQASDLTYQILWIVTGLAMVAKGGFFLLSNDEMCQSVLQWCLSREAMDYRFWGLGLCTLSVLLIHSCGWL